MFFEVVLLCSKFGANAHNNYLTKRRDMAHNLLSLNVSTADTVHNSNVLLLSDSPYFSPVICQMKSGSNCRKEVKQNWFQTLAKCVGSVEIRIPFAKDLSEIAFIHCRPYQ